MRGRTKRLAIAVALTIVDVAVANYYCCVIWQTFAQYQFARAAMLGLLSIWVASAVVIWLHVAYDLRQALDAATASTEAGRDGNV